jgi:hypothetical protein
MPPRRDVLAPRCPINEHRVVSWMYVVGAVGVIGLALWTWVKRDRSTRDDYGSISDQWRSEQRLKERDISDR